MKFYVSPCVDAIKMENGSIETTADLLSISTDNDLVWDWLVQGQDQILIRTRGN